MQPAFREYNGWFGEYNGHFGEYLLQIGEYGGWFGEYGTVLPLEIEFSLRKKDFYALWQVLHAQFRFRSMGLFFVTGCWLI